MAITPEEYRAACREKLRELDAEAAEEMGVADGDEFRAAWREMSTERDDSPVGRRIVDCTGGSWLLFEYRAPPAMHWVTTEDGGRHLVVDEGNDGEAAGTPQSLTLSGACAAGMTIRYIIDAAADGRRTLRRTARNESDRLICAGGQWFAPGESRVLDAPRTVTVTNEGDGTAVFDGQAWWPGGDGLGGPRAVMVKNEGDTPVTFEGSELQPGESRAMHVERILLDDPEATDAPGRDLEEAREAVRKWIVEPGNLLPGESGAIEERGRDAVEVPVILEPYRDGSLRVALCGQDDAVIHVTNTDEPWLRVNGRDLTQWQTRAINLSAACEIVIASVPGFWSDDPAVHCTVREIPGLPGNYQVKAWVGPPDSRPTTSTGDPEACVTGVRNWAQAKASSEASSPSPPPEISESQLQAVVEMLTDEFGMRADRAVMIGRAVLELLQSLRGREG